MNNETKYEATETLSKSLTNYSGYFNPDNRKSSASAFASGIEQKINPASKIAVSLGQRFGKVGKLEILWFFDSISKFSDEFAGKYNLAKHDSNFFATKYLSRNEAESLSKVELELLTQFDQLLLAITNENQHEFLQEIEVGVPGIKEIFDGLDSYFEKRAELMNSFSVRHDEITQMLTGVNNHISKRATDRPISELTGALEDKYAEFSVIQINLLEIFHNHIASYRRIAETSNEFNQSVVDYFNEYLRIIDKAKSIQESVSDADNFKLEELLKWSEKIGDYSAKLIQREAPEPKSRPEPKEKKSNLLVISAITAVIITAAVVYFFLFK